MILEDTVFDSINKGTLWPNTKLFYKKKNTFYNIPLKAGNHKEGISVLEVF
jgi:hypothetical protein